MDSDKIAVVGGSQGGGLALLAGALNAKVSAIVADIPNMCRMDYGILYSVSSLTEIAQYIKRFRSSWIIFWRISRILTC